MVMAAKNMSYYQFLGPKNKKKGNIFGSAEWRKPFQYVRIAWEHIGEAKKTYGKSCVGTISLSVFSHFVMI